MSDNGTSARIEGLIQVTDSLSEAVIKARIETLKAQRQQVLNTCHQLAIQRQQMLDNANAFNGAIQECEFWLNAIAGSPAEAPAGETG